MTMRAIVGLVLFNIAIGCVGAAILWGIGALRSGTGVVRLAGVAYLVGLASVMIALTLELVLGVPVRALTIGITLVGLVMAPMLLGTRLGYARPWHVHATWRLPGIAPLTAASAAVLIVYLVGVFRAARLSSALGEWDGWWMWLPKAKAIYYFGALDPELLEHFPHSSGSYPPGLPAVHAAAYHAMGSADDVTLHLQYWFYVTAFVAAVAGLLARRASAIIVVPLLLVALLSPGLVTRITWTYADLPLGYLVAIGALLVILWIEERQRWQLVAAFILLTGAMLTKREAALVVTCVLLAGFVVSVRERRSTWPSLAVAGVAMLALALPWRLWFTVQRLPSDAPSTGFLGGLADTDRAWPSLRLALTTLVDNEFWLLLPTLALIAIVLACMAREYLLATYAAAFTCFAVAAATWTTWVEPKLQISQDDAVNPIVRMTGTTVLTLAPLTALLLARAWSGRHRHTAGADRTGPGVGAMFRPSRAAWSIILVATLVYPASMLGGVSRWTLAGGMPHFPRVTDCVSTSEPGRPVRVTVGYADSYPEAYALRARAVDAGLREVVTAQDGCGRVRVFVDKVVTAASGGELAESARAAGLRLTLEAPGPGNQGR